MASLTCVFKNFLLSAVWKWTVGAPVGRSRNRGFQKLVGGGGWTGAVMGKQ